MDNLASKNVYQLIADNTACKLNLDTEGRKLTTYSIGGLIPALFEANSTAELAKLITDLKANQISYKVIGAGSNILINSAGISEVLIKLGRGFRCFDALEEGAFKVGASMSLMNLSRQLSDQGYSGLEFAGGIPASLGGAVRMNAGAHGGEMSEILESITYVDGSGEEQEVLAKNLEFKYRYCSLAEDAIVTEVKLKLKKSSKELTAKKRAEHLAARKASQPLTLPSSGSVFKNPSEGVYVGKLVEDLGLRGTQIGNAMISEMHGNWIVNPQKNASSDDVKALVDLIVERVKDKHSIELQRELIYWD